MLERVNKLNIIQSLSNLIYSLTLSLSWEKSNICLIALKSSSLISILCGYSLSLQNMNWIYYLCGRNLLTLNAAEQNLVIIYKNFIHNWKYKYKLFRSLFLCYRPTQGIFSCTCIYQDEHIYFCSSLLHWGIWIAPKILSLCTSKVERCH